MPPVSPIAASPVTSSAPAPSEHPAPPRPAEPQSPAASAPQPDRHPVFEQHWPFLLEHLGILNLQLFLKSGEAGSPASAAREASLELWSRVCPLAKPAPAVQAVINRLQLEPGISAHTQLVAYRKLACRELLLNLSPDDTMNDADVKHLPTLVACENARAPGLNLNYCPDHAALESLLRALTAASQSGEDQRARIIFKPYPEGAHHQVIEVFARRDQPLSILELESVPAGALWQASSKLAPSLTEWCMPFRLQVINPGVQRSAFDCAIFAFSFALKLRHQAAFFKQIHLQQLHDRPQAPLDDRLPPQFYKHAQSGSRLNNLSELQPDLAEHVVNKKGHTLKSRFEQFLVPDRALGTRNVSIEIKRIALIDRAILYLERTQGARPTDQPIGPLPQA